MYSTYKSISGWGFTIFTYNVPILLGEQLGTFKHAVHVPCVHVSLLVRLCTSLPAHPFIIILCTNYWYSMQNKVLLYKLINVHDTCDTHYKVFNQYTLAILIHTHFFHWGGGGGAPVGWGLVVLL